MEDLTFEQAKDSYVAARKRERARIRRALKAEGFDVKVNDIAGQGKKDYTSDNRLNPPFNLSNWMWMEAERNGISVLVTLQVLDRDPKSLNIHALVDRIGVRVIHGKRQYVDDESLFENCTTEFTLPLSDMELVELISMIERQTENICG